MAIESHIQRIAPVHNIGALSLETAPLKYSLKSEASSWKSQYSENLHDQASNPSALDDPTHPFFSLPHPLQPLLP